MAVKAINQKTHQRTNPKVQQREWRTILARRDLSISDDSDDYTDYEYFPELEGRAPTVLSRPYSPPQWDEELMGEGAFDRYKRITVKVTPGRRIEKWVDALQGVEYLPSGQGWTLKRPKLIAEVVLPKPVKAAAAQTSSRANNLAEAPAPNSFIAPARVAPRPTKNLRDKAKKENKENMQPLATRAKSGHLVEINLFNKQLEPKDVPVPVVKPSPVRKRKASAEVEVDIEPPVKRRRRTLSGRTNDRVKEIDEMPADAQDDGQPSKKRKRDSGKALGKSIQPKKPTTSFKKDVAQAVIKVEERPLRVTRAAILADVRVTRKTAAEMAARKPNYTGREPTARIGNVKIMLGVPSTTVQEVDRRCQGCKHLFVDRRTLERHQQAARAKLTCKAH